MGWGSSSKMSNVKMSKDDKKYQEIQKMSRRYQLYFMCLKMSNVKNSPVTGWGGLSEMSNIKMSRSQKDVNKLEIYMSYVKKSNNLTVDEVHKKFNLTQWHSDTKKSILRQNMKIIEKCSKCILWTFWRFSVTIICDIKIDLIVSEPHCVKIKFLWTSSTVKVFDFLTFDIYFHMWGGG